MTDSLRQGWGRGSAVLSVPPDVLRSLVADLFDGARLLGHAPLSGGLANTNIRLDLDRAPGAVVLRLAQRDPAALAREAALLRLAAGRGIPVAPLLHVDTDPSRLGTPFLVLGFVEGIMLDRALAEADGDDLAALGHAVGSTLAAVHGVHFGATGFLDAALAVVEPLDMGGAGLVAYARSQTELPLAAGRLGEARIAALHAMLAAQAGRLDAWQGAACLAHADANGSNILVRRDGGGWRVAALLDWEFAFSGSPFFDLGNATRPPAGEQAAYVDAIAAGYRAAGGVLPGDWPLLAQLVDLTAWLDFASRPEATPALLDDVRRMIDRALDGDIPSCR